MRISITLSIDIGGSEAVEHDTVKDAVTERSDPTVLPLGFVPNIPEPTYRL